MKIYSSAYCLFLKWGERPCRRREQAKARNTYLSRGKRNVKEKQTIPIQQRISFAVIPEFR